MRHTTLLLSLTVIPGLIALGCSSTNTQDGEPLPEAGSSVNMESGATPSTGDTGKKPNQPGDAETSDPVEEIDGTIKGLQLAAEAAGCTEDAGFPTTITESVFINKAVVTSPRFDAYTNSSDVVELHGYYVWDNDQAEWSGILLTLPADENTNFAPGDTLTLNGNLQEAWCNTQLSVEANGFELVENIEAPSPLSVDAASADLEPYEGMLIRLSDVQVESETTWGGYVLEGGIEVSYGFDFFLSMEVGSRYDITGQLRYAYGAYQLLPRSEADFNLVGEEPGTPGDGNTDPVGTVDPATLDGTIQALQMAAEDAGCSEDVSFPTPLAEGVSVNAAVVTSPRFDAYENSEGVVELHGYYLWDNNQAEWSGILLNVPASENTNFQLGDTLTLSGTLQEAWCNTQISVESNGYELTGTTDLVAPLTVAGATQDNMEPYEGMLITLSDVGVASETTWGGYALEGGIEVSYGFDFFLSMEVGSRYDITGQLRYAYGSYQLLPRSEADLVKVGEGTQGPDPGPAVEGTISGIQQSDDSLTCADSGNITTVDEAVTLEGIVTVESFEVHDTLNAYVISEGTNDPYSGIVFVVQKGDDEGWTLGQTLRITGSYLEFYCMSEISASEVEVTGESQTTVAPVPVDDFAANAEAYEGMLITLTNVKVTGLDNLESYGEIETDGGFLIDDWITGKEVITTPEVDAVYCSVTGVASYNFGTYRLNPRSDDDLVLCDN